MKFSVLMSVYKNDNPKFLNDALLSIYDNQTVKPNEIVVVFDGSLNDDLYNVLKKFREGKENIVFYHSLPKNVGLGEALKIGTKYCTGDYIFRMDSDDISLPKRFEEEIKYVLDNPEIDVVGSNIAEFNYDINENNKKIRACPIQHEKIVQMAKKRNPMNHVSVCIKKTALLKSGGYESLLLLEDYYLWLRMIVAKCRLANINKTLVYVRVGNGFYSKRGSKIRIKGWKFLQQYMYKNNLISKVRGFANMFCIRCFVFCPVFLRKLAYSTILRKHK